jgi:gliding motility-associated-like protein
MEEEFISGNTIEVTTFPSPQAETLTMVPGTYLPAESFDAFNGCPVNGDWTLTIRDNIEDDNGYIFEWSMEFNPEFDIDSLFYGPQILDAYWLSDPDIVVDRETGITVVPSQPGNNAFTFVAEDSFGCTHDTTYFVYVRPFPELANSIACNLSDSLLPGNSPAGGVYEVIATPTETADLIFGDISPIGVTDVIANEYGIYTVLYTENNCGYETTANIDFRPDPVIQPFFEDTTLCPGASIVYDAGPQEANSGNFIINWTRDGNTFNSEDLAVTVDQGGTYILTIEGFCSTVSDTSLVEELVIELEGDTICELTPRFVTAEVVPESVGGSWSSDEPSIIFTQPDFTTTQIIPGEYGAFEISYTDDRCPEHPATRTFLYIQQPDITLLPRNPEICFEEDSITFTAVVEGSTNGIFFWDIDSIAGFLSPPDFNLGQEASIAFPPESFRPLTTYFVTAETRDAFNICPDAGRDTIAFEPLACLYNIPNVITPNGDNRNDLFAIEFIENFPGVRLKIFNRWGNMVFENDDYGRYQEANGGWDPEDLPGGVYFFELELPSIDKVESGNVTVLTEEGNEQ